MQLCHLGCPGARTGAWGVCIEVGLVGERFPTPCITPTQSLFLRPIRQVILYPPLYHQAGFNVLSSVYTRALSFYLSRLMRCLTLMFLQSSSSASLFQVSIALFVPMFCFSILPPSSCRKRFRRVMYHTSHPYTSLFRLYEPRAHPASATYLPPHDIYSA